MLNSVEVQIQDFQWKLASDKIHKEIHRPALNGIMRKIDESAWGLVYYKMLDILQN